MLCALEKLSLRSLQGRNLVKALILSQYLKSVFRQLYIGLRFARITVQLQLDNHITQGLGEAQVFTIVYRTVNDADGIIGQGSLPGR